MFQDMHKVVMGGAMMFIFMVLVLSKFGWIELRVSDTLRASHLSSRIKLDLTIQFLLFTDPAVQHGFNVHRNVIYIGHWPMFIPWHILRTCSYIFALFTDGFGHR